MCAADLNNCTADGTDFFFFSSFLLSSLEVSDTKVYKPSIRANLETTELGVLNSCTTDGSDC